MGPFGPPSFPGRSLERESEGVGWATAELVTAAHASLKLEEGSRLGAPLHGIMQGSDRSTPQPSTAVPSSRTIYSGDPCRAIRHALLSSRRCTGHEKT